MTTKKEKEQQKAIRVPLVGAEFGSDDTGEEPMVRLHLGQVDVPRDVYDEIQERLSKDNTFEVRL